MHLGLLTPEWYEDETKGGIGTYCRALAAGAAALGHRVTVFAATTRTGRVPGGGVRPVVCDPKDGVGTARAFRDAWLAVPVDERPEVVEAADYCGAAALVAGSSGAPPITTRLHLPLELLIRRNGGGTIYRDDAERIELERRQVRLSAQLTSPSRWLAGEAVGLWGLERRPAVVPNPLPEGWLGGEAGGDGGATDDDGGDGEGDAGAARPPGPLRLLYFGRLEHRKGVLTLAEAAARHFATDGRPAELTFVGGDTRWGGRSVTELVRERLRDLPDGVAVRFRPAQDAAGVRAEIDRSDLVVLPSRYENFPYTCLEAMARGKAVLATSGSGFDDILRSGRNGFLAVPDDPAALAEALAGALAAPERLAEVGRRARSDVAAFAAARVVPGLLTLYDLIRTGSPASRPTIASSPSAP